MTVRAPVPLAATGAMRVTTGGASASSAARRFASAASTSASVASKRPAGGAGSRGFGARENSEAMEDTAAGTPAARVVSQTGNAIRAP